MSGLGEFFGKNGFLEGNHFNWFHIHASFSFGNSGQGFSHRLALIDMASGNSELVFPSFGF